MSLVKLKNVVLNKNEITSAKNSESNKQIVSVYDSNVSVCLAGGIAEQCWAINISGDAVRQDTVSPRTH